MPEGHTIHRAARDHAAALAGQALRVSSPQRRFDAAALLGGKERIVLRRIEAYGKHLFYVFEHGRTVHVHLGLFGKFYVRKNPPPAPRDTTRMRLEGAAVTIDLSGPTACELVTKKQKETILARIGPDPLREDADPQPFFDYVARSKAPIGAALMDQSVLGGVGNVYRAEALHLLGLHPSMACNTLPERTVAKMWKLLVGLLQRGVEEKRIVTTQGVVIEPGKKRILRREATHVYGQKACLTCGGPVQTFVQRARRVHMCNNCQPYR